MHRTVVIDESFKTSFTDILINFFLFSPGYHIVSVRKLRTKKNELELIGLVLYEPIYDDVRRKTWGLIRLINIFLIQ